MNFISQLFGKLQTINNELLDIFATEEISACCDNKVDKIFCIPITRKYVVEVVYVGEG